LTTCTPSCTSSSHSETCRSRASRTRAKTAKREQSDQNLPAYLSDELALSEEEQVGVELITKTPIKEADGNVIGVSESRRWSPFFAASSATGGRQGSSRQLGRYPSGSSGRLRRLGGPHDLGVEREG
jgi:hypothetical protein